MKRYLVYPFDFDSRAEALRTEIRDEWEEGVKALWRENRERTIQGLRVELGEYQFETKLQNFIDLGSAPFSIVSYHNALFHQSRSAFLHGLYYPALLGACALGERMLNHMILDLREEFRATPQYKHVYRKDAFDNWDIPIDALEAWGVFQHDSVAGEFRALKTLRNRSIHFDPGTYNTLREDALSALQHLARVINVQFGFQGRPRWLLMGTVGHFFMKAGSENDPFLRRFYLPQCPYVSPLFAMSFAREGILFFDFADVEDRQIDDEEFARLFNERDPKALAPSDLPAAEGVVCLLRPFQSARLGRRA